MVKLYMYLKVWANSPRNVFFNKFGQFCAASELVFFLS